ncbi:MAG: HesA/MoeB/ThiF family protein [Candidatus Lokiarchaeota archaeon]|nr:HesA/MoeB/ThiF family protein [Candidatus Harpocratesius repetitus]
MNSLKYDRQSRIPGWNQEKLSNASVAVIGAGALGNHVCLGLIGLGIGTIKIFDFDTISTHNLNRQSLFCEKDIGKNKAEVLAERLIERNSSLIIVGIDERIEETTIDSVIRKVDLVIDCVDRIRVRKILNYYCIRKNIPMIHGGLSWFGGQIGILTRKTPCINCIFPKSVQDQETQQETSCIQKPEPSVVYTSQIVAGFMVNCVRQVLLPLPSDPPLIPGLFKFDLRFEKSFYFERIVRQKQCECRKILKEVDPDILKQESKLERKQKKAEIEEIAAFLAETP